MVASRWARLGGSILDHLAVLVPLTVLFRALAPASWAGAGDSWSTLLNVSVFGLTALALQAAYNVALISRPGEYNGQTLGKQVTGTRVVGRDGGPITTRSAVKREVLGRALLGLVTPLAVADALAIFLPMDRRTFHDTIGGTLVVSAGWFPRAPVGAA